MTGSPLRAAREDRVVEIDEHRIALAYDPDGEVWFVTASSVPGLVGHEGDLDALIEELPLLVRQAALP